MNTFIKFLGWRTGLSKTEVRPDYVTSPYVPEYATPSLKQIHNPDPSKIQLTWVGHSTFLIQVGGLAILTDPIWSERASPIPWLGPKRYARPGIALSELPAIDIVVISHTHYDHLDLPTIKKLGPSPRYILPTNLAPWFADLGITNVSELAWWQDTTIEDIRITAVPAKHWSKRKVFGTENAGWNGYMIESAAGTVYFAGDTSSHPDYFKNIASKFPSIDLGLIPIGAYYPEFIFGRYHVNPHEAVALHREVGAKKSIGMHWGAFKLTEEPLGEPPILLAREAAAASLPTDEFSTMKIGETRLI